MTINPHSAASAGESYVIFSSFDPAPAVEAALRAYGVPAKALAGCYQGQHESAWIVNARDWPVVRRDWLTAGQESVLVLGPLNGAHGTRPATLHYLNGRLPEALGYFVPVSPSDARDETGWTYEPATYGDDGALLRSGQFYVCRHRAPSVDLVA
jgi:hypothetical protein